MKVFFIIVASFLVFGCGDVSTTSGGKNNPGFPDGAKNDSELQEDNNDTPTPGDSFSSYEKILEENGKYYCKMLFSCDEREEERSFFGTEEVCISQILGFVAIDSSKDNCLNFYSNKAVQCVQCFKSLSCAEYFGDEDKCLVCSKVCDWA